MWLGDNPGHEIYHQTIEGHKRIITLMTNKLLEHHKGIGAVYPIVGNHEGCPINQLELDENKPNWLFEFLADLWSPWLTPSCIIIIILLYTYSYCLNAKVRKIYTTASKY